MIIVEYETHLCELLKNNLFTWDLRNLETGEVYSNVKPSATRTVEMRPTSEIVDSFVNVLRGA